jgi:hypothetical protein
VAKQVLNIVDFSGGINKAVDKRDLQPNQVVHSDGLISFEPGKLTLDGTLNTIPGLNHNVGSFCNVTIGEGIPNLYGLFPEIAFRVFGKAKCSSSGSEATFIVDPVGAYHSLDVGAKLTIINIDVGNVLSKGIILTVSEIVSDTSFKATSSSTSNISTNDIIYYVLNASYDSDAHLLSQPNTGYDNNRFFLTASQYGKFGFYSTGLDKYWYGNVQEGYTNAFGNDGWFFDTKYLWDMQQHSDNVAGESKISDTRVLDSFYEDGAFRLLLDPPKAYRRGYCKRPVGLYAIDADKVHFDNTSSARYTIIKGMYALRTHCLSHDEYHFMPDLLQNGDYAAINQPQSKIYFNTVADSLSDWRSVVGTDLYKPNNIHIGVGHNDNGAAGDFQFDAGGEHRKIGLGYSFLYDDYENPQESNIALVYDGSTYNQYVTMTSGENNKALTLYVQINIGSSSLTPEQLHISDFASIPGSKAVAEFRGSGVSDGFSNFTNWNPRIVGACIYLTYNNDGPIDDPLLLATLNFNSEKSSLGLSKSHDGIEATSNWSVTDSSIPHRADQMFLDIPTAPVLKYSLKNGYKHNENIHAWYKTCAIVNRRLYAGNVSYYDKHSSLIEETEAPVNYPDRILVSPPNKFDILPRSSFLDVLVHDSQDIVKLVGFNQKLLIFKHDDLLVVDCSGELEVLEATHKGMGLLSPTQVCVSPNAIYWLNSQGVYGLDAENPPANIIKSKISTNEWFNKIYNNFTNIEYEPQNNLLLIISKYNEHSEFNHYAKHMFIVNLTTGSVFFKSNPSTLPAAQYSKGIVFNNQLYIAASLSNGSDEIFAVHNTTEIINGVKAEGVVQFTINNSSSRNTLGGTANKYLKINTTAKGWTRVNGETLTEWANVGSDFNSANRLVEEYNLKMNSANVFAGGADYDHSLIYDGDNNKFYAHVKAKLPGDTYSLLATSTTGSWGKSFYGLTNATSGDPDGLGDVENFENVYNRAGRDSTMPVWTIFANRSENTSAGITYILGFVGSTPEDAFLGTTQYTTSTDPAALYEGNSATYSDDSNSSANNLTNSNALITNMREHFTNGAKINISGVEVLLEQLFTVSVLATDSDASITGTTDLKYFTLTLKDNALGAAFIGASLAGAVDAGSGGSITKWESHVASALNNTNLETKDYDFDQPNVRKKIYKAYITYKASGNVKVFYKANQSSSWTAATVTDSVNDGQLPISATDYTRGEIKFGTGGNNVFSFALKFEGAGYLETFDVNDLSFIFRPKRAK